MSDVIITNEEDQKEMPRSTPRTLRLLEYKPEYYAGINQDDEATKMDAIIFMEDKPIVQFTGDQGKRKTSNIECLKALFGAEEIKNSINTVANKKSATLRFEYDGKKYEVRLTTGKFYVKMIQMVGDKEVKSDVDSPKDFLKSIIGAVGISPASLKNKSGDEQIKWLRQATTLTKQQQELETECKTNRKTAYDNRTAVNATYTRLQAEIASSIYYNWDPENKVFNPAEDLATDQKEVANNSLDDKEILVRLNVKKQEVEAHNLRVANQTRKQESKTRLEQEIEQLRQQLKQKEQQLTELDKAIADQQVLIENGVELANELTAIELELASVGKLQMKQKDINAVTAKLELFLKAEEQAKLLTGKIDEYDALWQEIVKSFTPDIEGMEVVLDDPKRADGIYYLGHKPIELAESELLELWAKLMVALDAKVIFVENVTSYGSNAVASLNNFSKHGTIFLSCMQRGQESLTVEFLNEIV